jgi:ribonucleoside-diphosphate reductase alpha chain
MSLYPLPAIAERVRGNRKIGLGVMGWADLLIELGIPYDSDQALEMAGRVMGFIATEARGASCDLARTRGPFPNHPQSIFADGCPQRNATITTVAPTGTLSLIAGCSAGIEPIFSIATERNILGGERLLEVQPAFARIARDRGFYNDDLLQRMASGDPDAIVRVPDDVLRLFVTAHQVPPEWHVRMQAAFQKHVDNAVSKTVNLPHEARPADVDRAYRLAWQLGCKGITIYRDASRQEQVLLKSNGRSLVCRECLVEDDTRTCPDCGGPLVHESGCHVCHGCGYTLC